MYKSISIHPSILYESQHNPDRGHGLHPAQVTSPMQSTDTIHTQGQLRVSNYPNVHIFGLWTEISLMLKSNRKAFKKVITMKVTDMKSTPVNQHIILAKHIIDNQKDQYKLHVCIKYFLVCIYCIL